MLQLEVECEKTHLVCDIIPGVVKDGRSEELWSWLTGDRLAYSPIAFMTH